jgi:hypothetical protein
MQTLPDNLAALQPYLDEILRLVRAEREQEHALSLPGGRLAVDEKEAAVLLGLNPWQLRDLRWEGHIDHHRIVGGRVRYTAQHLRDYLARGHEPPAPGRRRKPA